MMGLRSDAPPLGGVILYEQELNIAAFQPHETANVPKGMDAKPRV